jgi:hypothetical protein
MSLAARIAGLGLVGPGLADWPAARAILAGTQAYAFAPTVIPAPESLPATERRRAGKCVRLALATGLAAAADAGRPARDLLAVFTSSTGDGDTVHAICEALASDDRMISPTRFHNSVHNAPAGYWGIATGAMGASDSLAAYDASFGAGLVEALGRLAADPARPVLLVAYDAPYPEPLAATRPIAGAFAVAMVLAAEGAGPGITLRTTSAAAKRMSDPDLERVRAGIPAARSLPLLELVARGQAGSVVVDYLDDLALAIEMRP